MGDCGSLGNIPVKAVDHPLRWAIADLSPHDISRTLVDCGRGPGAAMGWPGCGYGWLLLGEKPQGEV